MTKSDTFKLRQIIFVALAILVFLCPTGCAKPRSYKVQEPESYKRSDKDIKEVGKTVLGKRPMLPPWQVWTSQHFGIPALEKAERLAESRQFAAAVRYYAIALSRATSPSLKEEILLRKAGTMLKIGQSQQALEDISKNLKALGKDISDVDSRLALVISFAYGHLGDLDQQLAWLGVSYRKSGGTGIVAVKATRAARIAAATVPDLKFEAFAKRWEADLFVSKAIAYDRHRRSMSINVANQKADPNWFSAETYSKDSEYFSADNQQFTEDVSSPGGITSGLANSTAVGVLLPLSGQYKRYGESIIRGIKLAFRESIDSGELRLVIADTQGSEKVASDEYERLAIVEKVSVILGPLLVKSAERVAERADKLEVPFVTFTKREGVPKLGPYVFRLGATVKDQVAELAHYATQEMGLANIAIVAPRNPAGEDYAVGFRDELSKLAITPSYDLRYVADNKELLTRVASEMTAQPPQAIFIPDTLENTWPLIKLFRELEIENVVLLGPAIWDDPVAIRGFGKLMEGAVYVTPFFASSSSNNVSAFVSSFRRAYQRQAEVLSAQAYDAAMMLKLMFSQQGGSSDDVRAELMKLNEFVGVTGFLRVDEHGDVTRRMTVLQIRNSEPVEVMFAGHSVGEAVSSGGN